jgi:hypothetical protein
MMQHGSTLRRLTSILNRANWNENGPKVPNSTTQKHDAKDRDTMFG